jgi:transposase
MALHLRPLTDEERTKLERLTHAQTAPVRLARRARIIALAATGLTVPAIAVQVGQSEECVRRWTTPPQPVVQRRHHRESQQRKQGPHHEDVLVPPPPQRAGWRVHQQHMYAQHEHEEGVGHRRGDERGVRPSRARERRTHTMTSRRATT